MDATTPKPFAWSYSRLKAFEDCPRRYFETSIKKAWPEEKSDMLVWGDAVHKAMADALRGKPLPLKFQDYQHWIDKVNRTDGEILIEDDCRWACTRDLQRTTWFADNVWLRTIADAVKINPPVALVVDWKTGKSMNADALQLTLTSLMVLLRFPDIECVRSDFIWLQEDSQTTQAVYRDDAEDHWAAIMPRVKRLEQAILDDRFPPLPGRFCRSWCSVKSCEYNGK